MDGPAISGPPAGFRELYDDELNRTWRVLVRLGVADAAIEDAVQDVFVTAFRGWYRLRDPTLRHAWLMGIARRIAYRYRRGQQRHVRKLDALGTAVSEPVPGPEDALQREQGRARLRAFVDALDPPRREAFVLGELEELDRKHLGAILGINPNTAYSRLASARREFARRFGEDADVLAHDSRDDQAPEPVRARAWALLAAQWQPGAAVGPIAIAAATKWAIAAAIVVAGVLATTQPLGGATEPPRAATTKRALPTAPTSIEMIAIPPASLPASAAAVVEPTPVLPPAAPSRRTAMLERPAPPAETPSTDRAPIDGIDAETELLGRARRAALAGDRDTARALLDEHRDRFGKAARMASIRDALATQLDGG